MSLQARRFRRSRGLCACGRKALFRSRVDPRLRRRKDHPLCFQCHRRLTASSVARTLAVHTRRFVSALLGSPAPMEPTPFERTARRNA
jgi:hypothetical protein